MHWFRAAGSDPATMGAARCQSPQMDAFPKTGTRFHWLAALLGALAFLALAGCLRPVCVYKVLDVFVSPVGRLKLVIFSRECGGTVSNLQASLLDAAEKLPERGANAVVVDDGKVNFKWQPEGGVVVEF